jgi:hypothetical protein
MLDSSAVLETSSNNRGLLIPRLSSSEILGINQPKSYDWKREEYPEMNFEKGIRVGFITQEAESIIPEMVQIDKVGIYALKYSEFVPILVKAM